MPEDGPFDDSTIRGALGNAAYKAFNIGTFKDYYTSFRDKTKKYFEKDFYPNKLEPLLYSVMVGDKRLVGDVLFKPDIEVYSDKDYTDNTIRGGLVLGIKALDAFVPLMKEEGIKPITENKALRYCLKFVDQKLKEMSSKLGNKIEFEPAYRFDDFEKTYYRTIKKTIAGPHIEIRFKFTA